MTPAENMRAFGEAGLATPGNQPGPLGPVPANTGPVSAGPLSTAPDSAGTASPGQASTGQASAGPGDTGPASTGPAGPAPSVDIDQIASIIYDRIEQRLGPRADAAQDMPPVDQAIALREKAPELYDLWLRIAQEKAATGNYVQRAPYEVPERLATSGRPRALSAMIIVLAFCGYLAWLGGPGPYIGGLIAVFDLAVMLGLFFGLRPDHLSESARPRKRRLTAARCRSVAPAVTALSAR